MDLGEIRERADLVARAAGALDLAGKAVRLQRPQQLARRRLADLPPAQPVLVTNDPQIGRAALLQLRLAETQVRPRQMNLVLGRRLGTIANRLAEVGIAWQAGRQPGVVEVHEEIAR